MPTVNPGTTSLVESVFIQDSTSTTGAGKTGLAYNTSGLTCYYKRSNGTASVSVSLASITTLGTFVSGGFKEIDSTNMPGLYEFDPPDAGQASSATGVTYYFQGATGMAPCVMGIDLKADPPAAAAIATAIWEDTTAGGDFATAGSIGLLLATDINATISSRLASASYTTPPTAAAVATAIFEDLTDGGDFGTAGSIGLLLATYIDAAVSSRSTYAGGAVASVTGNVGGDVAGKVLGGGSSSITGVGARVAFAGLGF